MSYDVMKACRPLQMPSSPKAVLMALADYADEAGSAWPSIPTLCEYTCLSERTVHAAIKWLEQAKVVLADRANGRHTTYVVDANSFQQPPQQLHPRSSCTPANPAVTTAAVAVVPPQIPQSPPQQLHPRSSCTPANPAVTTAAVAVVPPQIPQSPPQQLHPRSSCTPANPAVTTAAVAVVPPQIPQSPPQQLHPRSSCTPANPAVTTAAVAVVPPQIPQSPPQQLRSNNQEQPKEQPGTTNKRVRKPKAPGFDAMTVDLPDWLPAESWERWVRHRVQLKKPITEEAARQQIADLGTFLGQGHKPDEVIRYCIGKSWQGLFPPKQAFGPRAAPAISEAERRKQEFLRLAAQGGGQDNYTLDMEQA
ncbi:helix-turn-helix domain-containing protein [Bordetella bronchiseptica]|uniref:helix-turn-helix domain-containing protein n=1 Tax=Bordetella bronchiseptica TaxID=518 RepID=UPI00403C38A3